MIELFANKKTPNGKSKTMQCLGSSAKSCIFLRFSQTQKFRPWIDLQKSGKIIRQDLQVYKLELNFVLQSSEKDILILQMAYKLPELPYAKDSFGGILSPETFDYHYGKHHQTYITNLNNLIKGTEWENKTLDEIVVGCKDQKIFNNAAQHWNHTFYWYCMTPDQNEPTGALKDAIVARWGSVQKCLEDFSAQAVANFGSGWTWLAKQGNDIAIVNTSNAGNPLTNNYQPLLTVDIWEHAYYIDYRNVRAKYVENFTKLINWKFVEGNFSADKVTIKL